EPVTALSRPSLAQKRPRANGRSIDANTATTSSRPLSRWANVFVCNAHTPVSMLGKMFSTMALPRKSDRCFSDRSPVTRVASGALSPGRGSSPFSSTGLPFSVTVAMGSLLAGWVSGKALACATGKKESTGRSPATGDCILPPKQGYTARRTNRNASLMPVDLQSLYPKLIRLLLDTVFVVDGDDRIVFVGDTCETLLGYSADELVGTLITDYMHPDDLAATRCAIGRIVKGEHQTAFRNRYVRKDGSVVHILWSARWSKEDGVRIGVARDVTALTEAEAELQFLAHHDPLTRLTNRWLFHDRLVSALRAARRHQDRLALLFVDINDFKVINDAHGHAVGDRVLCEVARRLETCVRECDTVARLGGDEFVILLTDIHSADAVAAKAEQIKVVMAEPLHDESGEIDMPTCSIGVACYPDDGDDADTLLAHADARMYTEKRGIEPAQIGRASCRGSVW